MPYLTQHLIERFQPAYHRFTYEALASAKNVVVIGGSFAGFELAKHLCESLPTGYRVVLVEKNSHLHYVFAFPGYSVVRGYEDKAFIPFDDIARRAPKSIFQRIQGEVVKITDDAAFLLSGAEVPYEFLAFATGTS